VFTVTDRNHARFPQLFKPYALKGVELQNRVAISGHFAGWWVGPGGLPSFFISHPTHVLADALATVGRRVTAKHAVDPLRVRKRRRDVSELPRTRLKPSRVPK